MTAPLLTLAETQALLPGSALVGDAAVAWQRVSTDTRSVQAGDLLIALKGERFDAHDFLAEARRAGAVAAVAERGLAAAGLPGLEVADSLHALGALAAGWRRRFAGLPLIAVAGSNGKTTVTQMISAILRAWQGDAALATAGNFNNAIGVPLTLLRLRPADGGHPGHRVAVVELGMNHAGEIAVLAAMAAPTVALVNNAQREHQEFMDGVEAVARENGAVIEALGAGGTAVFPAGDEHTPLWRGLAGARAVLTFALDRNPHDRAAADIAAHAVWKDDHWALALRTPRGGCDTTLRLPGLHNATNALAAAACALAAGAPLDAVRRGLATFEPVAGRSQTHKLVLRGREVTLVDDSYNANPDSVRAAIDVLASLPRPHWLVLGDMGEVGAEGVAFHQEVGRHAKMRGIETLWTCGRLCTHAAEAFGAPARHFNDMAALLAGLAREPHFASVLVKGSRFMRMERVVAALLAESAAQEAERKPVAPAPPARGGRDAA